MEDKKEDTEEISTTKYGIVPKFWTNPNEIPCLDIVSVHNKVSGRGYVKFIDELGRLGAISEDDVGIIFINFPTVEDMEDFERLKKEAKSLEKIILDKKIEKQDMSFS